MGLVHTSCRTTAIHCEWHSDESGHTRVLEVKWSHIMETNILSAIRDRNILWIVIFYYLYYKAPNISSVPGSITMRDFKNNCFKKEFSLISTEKKGDSRHISFWDNTTMWLLSFSFSLLLLLLCNLEFKTREKILPKSSQHSIDQEWFEVNILKKKTLCKRLVSITYYVIRKRKIAKTFVSEIFLLCSTFCFCWSK